MWVFIFFKDIVICKFPFSWWKRLFSVGAKNNISNNLQTKIKARNQIIHTIRSIIYEITSVGYNYHICSSYKNYHIRLFFMVNQWDSFKELSSFKYIFFSNVLTRDWKLNQIIKKPSIYIMFVICVFYILEYSLGILHFNTESWKWKCIHISYCNIGGKIYLRLFR